MQQKPWTVRSADWSVPTKMTPALIAKGIRKSSSYFESLASVRVNKRPLFGSEAQGAAEFMERRRRAERFALIVNCEFGDPNLPIPHAAHAGEQLHSLLFFAILAIPVVVIILPVLSMIKMRADRAEALNRMNQLGAAAANYMAENAGALPATGSKSTNSWADAASPENANAWYNVLPGKLGHKGVDQYAAYPQAFYSHENILFLPGAVYPESDKKLARPFFAIAINAKLQPEGEKPVKLAQITHPARTVLLLEQGLPKEPKAMAQQPKYDGSPSGSAKSFVARYRGVGLVTFVDGHAEYVDGKDVLEENGQFKFPVEPGNIIWSKTPEENPNK